MANSKILRQIRLFNYILYTECHGPSELIRYFKINKRMLGRDLKDLRDSGVIDLKYDKESDNYIVRGEAVFDDTAAPRRKQHLRRLYRLCRITEEFETDYMEALEEYAGKRREYEEEGF